MGPLKYRDFRLLWTALVLQGIGTWVYQVASGWLILELTGSPLLLGFASALQSIPFLATALYGGALADRMERRTLLLLTQSCSTFLALGAAVLALLHLIQPWHLYVLNFLVAAVGGLDGPARTAMVPSLVPRIELMRALALTAIIRRGSALIGPMIGGAAITFTGVSGAFFAQAAFLTLTLACTASMRVRPMEITRQRQSMTRAILDGMRYVRRLPLILGPLTMDATSQLFILYVPILPVFARDVLKVGPDGLGALYAAPGIGAVLGSLSMLFLGHKQGVGKIFSLTAAAKPVVMTVFAFSRSMPLSMLMLAAFGFLDVASGTARTTIFQTVTEDQMRGRVMSLDLIVQRGLGTLSGLPLGGLASLIGAPLAMAAGAVGVMTYVVAQLLRVPAIYRYSHHQQPLHVEPAVASSRPP